MNLAASFSVAERVQGRLAHLISEARSTSLGGGEFTPSQLVGLRGRVGKLLEQGEDALRGVLETLEDELDQDPLVTAEIAGVADGVPSTSREAWADLADLCSLMLGDLAHKRSRLHRLPDVCPAVTVLSTVEDTLETLAQGLCTVERGFADLAETPSRTRHVDLVRDALKARRASAKFQRVIFTIDGDERSAVARLRSGSSTLTRLIGRDEFRSHRVVDRFTARKLHRDILEWAREGCDERAAERLWTEVVAFAMLVGDINQRQILQEHDQETLASLVDFLSELPPSSPCPAGARSRLAALEGRDAILDDLVRDEASSGEVLERLHALSGASREPGWEPA